MRRSQAEQVFDVAKLTATYRELAIARDDVADCRRQFLAQLLETREGGVSQGRIGAELGLSQQRVQQLEQAARVGVNHGTS